VRGGRQEGWRAYIPEEGGRVEHVGVEVDLRAVDEELADAHRDLISARHARAQG
jgi:hypothetical protein